LLDYWALAKDFHQGDAVQKINPVNGSLGPYVGVIKHAHPGLGVLDIQWPFGVERIHPDEVVKVNPELMLHLPPTLNQVYGTWDTRRLASARTSWYPFPPGIYTDMAQAWHHGRGAVGVYDDLYRKYSGLDDLVLRGEVSKFYTAAKVFGDYRVAHHAVRTASYWVAENRQYRVTADELDARKPRCPKCGTRMRKTTYKMKKGERHRLLACPKDLFLVKTTDMLGPDGKAVDWLAPA